MVTTSACDVRAALSTAVGSPHTAVIPLVQAGKLRQDVSCPGSHSLWAVELKLERPPSPSGHSALLSLQPHFFCWKMRGCGGGMDQSFSKGPC